MKSIRLNAIAVICWISASATANGGVSSFTDLASYETAASTELLFIDFDDNIGNTDGTSFHALVDFDSIEATNPDIVQNSQGILRDLGSTIAPNNVGPIGGSFSSPVGGIAFDLSSVEGTAQTVRLYGPGAILIDEILTPVGNTFFGVVSTTPIEAFVIQNGMFASGVGNDRYFLDNFRANAVPEPSSILMALIWLGLSMRTWTRGVRCLVRARHQQHRRKRRSLQERRWRR